MQDLYLTTNGIKLHVHNYEANGQAIIFIHYGSGVIPDWNNVIPYFQENYHIIVPEMRGHGLSDKPKGCNTVNTMAADVIGILDALNLDKAHIVGSSLGSDLGIILAANYSERILSISCEGPPQNTFGPYGQFQISDPVMIDLKKKELRKRRASRKALIIDSKERLIDGRRSQLEQAGHWAETMAASVEYNVAQTDDGKFTTMMPAYVMDEFLEDYWDIEFEHYFDQIKCPVLLLPSEDELSSENMRAFITRAGEKINIFKVVEIPGSTHGGPMFFQPKQFSEVVLKFLGEIK